MADKTWTQLQDEIEETFRKWHMDAPTITCILPKRSAAKRYQSEDERTVTIRFRTFIDRKGWKEISLTVKREERAVDNLALIAKAVEMVRLARVRGVTDLIVLLYRQTHPDPQRTVINASSVKVEFGDRSGTPSGPYTVLHLASNAPLEVCEAAYKALVRKHHPDLGGDTATMQRLNQAIEQIRKEKNA